MGRSTWIFIHRVTRGIIGLFAFLADVLSLVSSYIPFNYKAFVWFWHVALPPPLITSEGYLGCSAFSTVTHTWQQCGDFQIVRTAHNEK